MNINEKFTLAVEMKDMINEGMQPIDCLYYAISAGWEYPDAVYFVTRVLNLNDDAVFELEAAYN
jgi:hypothetical protein